MLFRAGAGDESKGIAPVGAGALNPRASGGDQWVGSPMQRSRDQIIDELLVLESQGGNRAAMDLLLRRWGDRIHARAGALCGRGDGGAEVAQRSMIAVARGIGSLDDPSALGGWIFRIVAHKASDWIRERGRERRRSRDGGGPARGGASGGVPSVGDGEWARVRRALDRLKPDRRAILVLHYGHGVGIEGLARVLDIPPGTAKSRLFHARRELGRLLERDER